LPEFLVCYDYGQGGVWRYLLADSRDAVIAEYPMLTVFDSSPPWWTDEIENAVRKSSEDEILLQNWLNTLKSNNA
jgi:hypothetical protein